MLVRLSVRLSCLVCLLILCQSAGADVYDWQTGLVIPGTEGITPGPGVNFYRWNSDSKHLQSADFAGFDLSGSRFEYSWLDHAHFTGSNLTGADLEYSRLSGADFTGAIITNANLGNAANDSFTKEQLYSTASYQNKDLRGVSLWANDLVGCDFTQQNLTGARLSSCRLSGADFTDAVVENTSFSNTTHWNFTKERLYSTASYKNKNLRGIGLGSNDLFGWDFSQQDLTGANFQNSWLSSTNFTDAIIKGASFKYDMLSGSNMTETKLYSTASYKNKDLGAISFWSNTLSGWDLSGQNLSGSEFIGVALRGSNLSGSFAEKARFSSSTLTDIDLSNSNISRGSFRYSDATGADFSGADLSYASCYQTTFDNADFTDATIKGINLRSATSYGFTKEQLYSTASYKNTDLERITLSGSNLSGWDFSNQNLTGAYIYASNLTGADFSGAIIKGASFDAGYFGSAAPSESSSSNSIQNAVSSEDPVLGISQEQLYSTASYENKDLGAVSLAGIDLSGWDLSHQNMAYADFYSCTVAGTNFNFADLRGSWSWSPDVTTLAHNTIRPNGEIRGFHLLAGERLVVRNLDLAIDVTQTIDIDRGSTLSFLFDDQAWGSTIHIDSGLVPELDGGIELLFAEGTDIRAMIGQTFDLFDWNGTLLPGQAFSEILTEPGLVWDTDDLYTTGEVTLVVPEPVTVVLFGFGGLVVLRRRRGSYPSCNLA